MKKKHRHLTQDQRFKIYLLHAEGKSLLKIAHTLGVHKSTISRELKRNHDPRVRVYPPDKSHILYAHKTMGLVPWMKRPSYN
ncbi:helix-turn-helix domain-containing protein [Candidatus Bealeia paramacronuclearis]|uniref:helix-turn-helix domain-containing protein n=1 Tax=Candidatus Bealeia paramacronuclearis TaxID=1921001 RepID=UPI0039C3003D